MIRILTVILLFISISSFGQKRVRYAKARELNVGLVEGTKINWDTLKEPVHFFIEVSDSGAVINSGRKQTYRFLELLRKDDSVTKYYCIDEEQKNCVIWMFSFKNSPSWFSIGAEYADVAWYYNCDILKDKK